MSCLPARICIEEYIVITAHRLARSARHEIEGGRRCRHYYTTWQPRASKVWLMYRVVALGAVSPSALHLQPFPEAHVPPNSKGPCGSSLTPVRSWSKRSSCTSRFNVPGTIVT